MTAPAPAPADQPGPAPDGATNVERARAAIHALRRDLDELDELDQPADANTRFFDAMVRLLERATDDAAGVEAMNERTRRRADRIGGDGHTWVMHRAEWAIAMEAVVAWEDSTRA